MPAVLSFPGVYIDEVPSGVRAIAGVPTAICAFVGRTLMGPANTPVIINSFADFERSHGGLNVLYPLSYALRDFFLNGGAQAVVARLYGAPIQTSPPGSPKPDSLGISRFDVTASGGAPQWTFNAASPGTWSNTLRINIAPVTDTTVAPALGMPTGTQLFDVIVKQPDPNNPSSIVTLERIRNLTLSDTARKWDSVLPNESHYLLAPAAGTTGNPDPTNVDTLLSNYTTGVDYTPFGPGTASAPGADSQNLADTVFLPGGAVDTVGKTGVGALEKTDTFNLLCIPPETRAGGVSSTLMAAAAGYCAQRRAMFIVDPPANWTTVGNVNLNDVGITGLTARNAAVYFPRILQGDPLRGNQLDTFVPCGIIAGAIASTDATRGVFKAPAGIDVGLTGVRGLSTGGGNVFTLSDAENGQLNPIGVNCIRTFPVLGTVVWGARTLRGADTLGDDYKYLPVRRLALFIEESLYRGTKFAVFEPNDEPLWSQIRLNVGAFMQGLFRQGAFQGQSPRDAYFVKCDKETTTQSDINLGVVNILVAFAPLKPAEFVVIKIQQIAGQIST